MGIHGTTHGLLQGQAKNLWLLFRNKGEEKSHFDCEAILMQYILKRAFLKYELYPHMLCFPMYKLN